MPLVRIVLARTASPIVAAVKRNPSPQKGSSKKPGFSSSSSKKTNVAKKTIKQQRRKVSDDVETVAIPSKTESNVVAALWRRKSTDEDDVVSPYASSSSSPTPDDVRYYTLQQHSSPEAALPSLLLAPNRREVTTTTLRALGLKEQVSPVWPPVSVFAADGPSRDIHDPTTRERLTSIRSAKWAHVDAVLSRAASAQRRWATLPGTTRVRIVKEIDDEIKSRASHLSNLLVLEIGKVPSEASGEIVEIHEVTDAIVERVDECGGGASGGGGEGDKADDAPYPVRTYPSRDPRRAALGWKGEERRLPIGVVGKITAFNFPYAPFAWGALPALAAGNAVVWKPHPHAILCGMALARCFDDVLARHGFSGLVAAFDAGADTPLVHKMCRDARVNMVEATGGEEMGAAITQTLALDGGAAKIGTRVNLELGGNNAVVIHSDADIDQAVESVLFGATGTAGQRCTTTRVAYVHEDVYDDFEDRLVDGYRTRVRVGDPLTENVNVGPVFHKRAVARFQRGVTSALDAGSELLCGGDVLGGNFVEPTLFRAPLDDGFDHPPTERELFSPVLHLVRYREGELDRVVNDINRTGYGLSAGVFTSDLDVFERLVTSIRVGILNLNYGTSGAEAGENFGGEGRTGGGRQMGPGMFTNYVRYVNSMRAPHGGEVIHAQGVGGRVK